MADAPRMIGGAKVICFTPIDGRHHPTSGCRQIVAGILQGPATGLVICQYEGDECFYLLGCDADWNSVTDTWHETLDEALGQAEFEYVGASKTWREHAE